MVDQNTQIEWAAKDAGHSLAEIRDGWEHAARQDAKFNILTIPGKEGCWGDEEFFARGTVEIEAALERLKANGLEPEGKALDFGCGVGRLTQALGRHFDAHGVDVSKEMIRQAREYHPDLTFHVNQEPNLQLFDDGEFDLIYTIIVLQHMPHALQQGYVAEFIRLLTDNGVALFQIPDGPEYIHPNKWLSMYGATQEAVDGWVTAAGGKVVDVENLGREGAWVSRRYTVVKA